MKELIRDWLLGDWKEQVDDSIEYLSAKEWERNNPPKFKKGEKTSEGVVRSSFMGRIFSGGRTWNYFIDNGKEVFRLFAENELEKVKNDK